MASFATGFVRPADWLLSRQRCVRLSGETLQHLSCYLQDFSLLRNFKNLTKLQLVCPDNVPIREGVPDCWVLSREQAGHVAALPALTELCFMGFTDIQLDHVPMPHLNASLNTRTLTIVFQALGRLFFALFMQCTWSTSHSH